MTPCRNGHTSGRYKNGKCRECHVQAVIRSRTKRIPYGRKRVPSEPLRGQVQLAALGDEGLERSQMHFRAAYAERFGLTQRQVDRDMAAILRAETVSLAVADRVCCFLGLHLDLVFDPKHTAVLEELWA